MRKAPSTALSNRTKSKSTNPQSAGCTLDVHGTVAAVHADYSSSRTNKNANSTATAETNNRILTTVAEADDHSL
jgi:hypothetical protein